METYAVSQPFVQMTKEPVDTIDAQPIDAALDGKRKYSVFHFELHKNNIKLPTNPGLDTGKNQTNVDLTMKIGGKVWVDGSVGKEDKYDGKYGDGDTPMSNVKVSLYQVSGLDGNQSGKFIAATTTDNNGEYLFQNQNAMYQYYVKFTYNGQY